MPREHTQDESLDLDAVLRQSDAIMDFYNSQSMVVNEWLNETGKDYRRTRLYELLRRATVSINPAIAKENDFVKTALETTVDEQTGVVITSILDDMITECSLHYARQIRNNEDTKKAVFDSRLPIAQALDLSASSSGLPNTIRIRLPQQINKYQEYKKALEEAKSYMDGAHPLAQTITAKASGP